jgi:hypothetical protein
VHRVRPNQRGSVLHTLGDERNSACLASSPAMTAHRRYATRRTVRLLNLMRPQTRNDRSTRISVPKARVGRGPPACSSIARRRPFGVSAPYLPLSFASLAYLHVRSGRFQNDPAGSSKEVLRRYSSCPSSLDAGIRADCSRWRLFASLAARRARAALHSKQVATRQALFVCRRSIR